MTPAEALAALRAAEARDGAPNLTQRRAMLLSLAREVKKRAQDIMALLESEYEGPSLIPTRPCPRSYL